MMTSTQLWSFRGMRTSIAFLILLGLIWISTPSAAECSPTGPSGLDGQWENTTVDGFQVLPPTTFRYTLSPELGKELQPGVPRTILDIFSPEPSLRVICFIAVRFNTEKVALSLIDVVSEIETSAAATGGVVRRSDGPGGEPTVQPVRYSLRSLIEFTDGRDNILAIANAGLSRGSERPNPIGFLLIDGVLTQPRPVGLLSAFLCVNSRERNDGPKLFYYAENGPNAIEKWSNDKAQEFAACQDIVQVGPRIIEKTDTLDGPTCLEETRLQMKPLLGDEEKIKKVGICSQSLVSERALRTVVARDTRSNAVGWTYLLMSLDATTLFDLQVLLLHDALYEPGQAYWAVDVAGPELAGFVLALEDTQLEGNVDGAVRSALVVRSR